MLCTAQSVPIPSEIGESTKSPLKPEVNEEERKFFPVNCFLMIVVALEMVAVSGACTIQVSFKKPNSLLFCLITCDRTSWRARRIDQYIRDQSLLLDNVFFTKSNTTYGGLHTITTSERIFNEFDTFLNFHMYTKETREMITKFVEMLDYFLHQTDHTHMIRATDDIWINSRLVLQMIRNLERDKVTVQGACFVKHISIIQGGSGIIISRRAAEILWADRYMIFSHISGLDDWTLSHAWNKLVPMAEQSSNYFIGTGLSPQQIGKLLIRKNWTVAKCQKGEIPLTCNHQLIFLRNLVIVHQYGIINYKNYEDIVWKAPPMHALTSRGEFYYMCETEISNPNLKKKDAFVFSHQTPNIVDTTIQ